MYDDILGKEYDDELELNPIEVEPKPDKAVSPSMGGKTPPSMRGKTKTSGASISSGKKKTPQKSPTKPQPTKPDIWDVDDDDEKCDADENDDCEKCNDSDCDDGTQA